MSSTVVKAQNEIWKALSILKTFFFNDDDHISGIITQEKANVLGTLRNKIKVMA